MVRYSNLNDVDSILELFQQAKDYLKNRKIDQWQNGYPNRNVILEDIKDNDSYVLEEKRVIGTMCFHLGMDEDYNYIEGSWNSDQPYGVIHRLVIDESLKGQRKADELLQFAINKAKSKGILSLRVDTHPMNLSMQRFLERNGFEKCGIIYIHHTDLRFAYEKILNCEDDKKKACF